MAQGGMAQAVRNVVHTDRIKTSGEQSWLVPMKVRPDVGAVLATR